MRTRDHDWYDTKRRVPMYSFQVFINGGWCHPHDSGKPLIFDTKEERDTARAKARKSRHAQRQGR